MSRLLTGLSASSFILFLLYQNYIEELYYIIQIALLCDIWFLVVNKINRTFVLFFSIFMLNFQSYLIYLYKAEPYIILSIAFITQISDAYQYYIGLKYGIHKIGWISKNKSYEGYIGGYLLTLITFIYFHTFDFITIVYILGILGGLTSSYFKRLNQIKDYSNLLGDHGGWTDRLDSIILPVLFFGYLSK